ncbi:MAG: bifunctional enoyl-CoA hydratase/phosphate acetyltransferase [Spirochaetota bacterium]
MNFNDLFDKIKNNNNKIRKIAVAGAENDHIIEACLKAKKMNIADFILVGDLKKINETLNQLNIEKDFFEIIDIQNDSKKAQKCCELFRDRQAELIMKGSVSTPTLLKEVLKDEYGIKGSGFLSHIACIEFKNRLLGITDGGLNIAPNLEEKIKIVQNSIDFYRKLGIEKPKVAITCAIETPNPKMQATIDASIIAKMSDRGDIKGGIVDGPFGLDNALDIEAAKIKKINSPVAGLADIIVAPDIEAANMTAKGIIYTSRPQNGGLIIGSTTPIILLSRADDADTKFNSILLALSTI